MASNIRCSCSNVSLVEFDLTTDQGPLSIFPEAGPGKRVYICVDDLRERISNITETGVILDRNLQAPLRVCSVLVIICRLYQKSSTDKRQRCQSYHGKQSN